MTPPAIWRRRGRGSVGGVRGAGVDVRAGDADCSATGGLAATGTGYLLGLCQAQAFRNGYFDQTAQLWNEAGDLLATTHQVVYYKE